MGEMEEHWKKQDEILKKDHEDWDKLREHYAEEKGTIEKTRREIGIKKRRGK